MKDLRSNFNTRELNTREIMFLKNTKMNITRSHELGFGRPLVKIHARSLPELFQQPRDLDNSQEAEKLRPQNFKNSEKNPKHLHDYLRLSVIGSWIIIRDL